jgi:hypothetical protein
MAIAPAATWDDQPIRIPQTLLAEWVPLYRTLRETYRLGIAGLMGLALAAGLGFALCAARLPGRGRTIAAGATLLALLVGAEMYREYRAPGLLRRPALPREYPLLKPPAVTDPIVEALARGQGPVLEVPVRDRIFIGVPGYQTRAMYRGIFHRRPLVNGYGGYWPPGFRERMLLATELPASGALAALRQQTGLATVVVNTTNLPPAELATWQRTLAEGSDALRAAGTYGDAVLVDVRGD